MGLDYVDIFYSHRFDPDTPLEETMGALDTAVRAGQGALRRDLLVLLASGPGEAAAILRELGTPLLIHQPSYSMLNRWIEDDHLLDTLDEVGAGCIAFSPLAQGLLTDRYLDGVPADSRVATGGAMTADMLTDDRPGPGPGAQRDRRRGAARSLAQLALAWALRDPRMTVAGDRREQRRAARGQRRRAGPTSSFTDDELAEIDRHALESGIDLWAESSAE